MGWKLYRKDLKLKPNQERDLNITLKFERRAAIHGVVKFPDGCPVEGAVVKLFKKVSCKDKCNLVPVTFTFTDECGQFLFGVDSCVQYVVKVFFYVPEKPEPCESKKDDYHGSDDKKHSCNYYDDDDD